MEMVAATKMRKAQERMRAGRPYATKVRAIAAHLMQANPEYRHPYTIERPHMKAVGIVVVSTDKGLCGGLNTNIMRQVLARMKEFGEKGIKVQATALGSKATGLLTRIGADLEIGRASCRERVCKYVSISGGAGSLKHKTVKKPTTT